MSKKYLKTRLYMRNNMFIEGILVANYNYSNSFWEILIDEKIAINAKSLHG